MASDDDDWFFDSVKNYRNLFMYDLQHPVTCMDWVDDKNLVVATSSDARNEILELSVPDKLLSDDSESAGLLKDRDFRQKNGGFSTCKICCIKHIPKSRQVCTSDETNTGIQVWKIGSNGTDLIELAESFKSKHVDKSDKKCFSKIAVNEDKPACIVFGSSLNNLCCLDVEKGTIHEIYDKTELTETSIVSEIKFMDQNSLISCCENSGEIKLIDLRVKQEKSDNNRKGTSNTVCDKCSYWTMDITVDLVYRLSSAGSVVISDVRNGSDKILQEMNTQKQSKTKHTEISIKASPQQKQNISLSGFDGNVYIYDTQKSPVQEFGYSFTEPIFNHQGHVKNCSDQSDIINSLAHLWHPWKPDLIMSSGSEGSLHAWEYCLPNT
ncbi:unnamed protein product [Mytilus edulis]|uniref:Uncharacterized protein n=1 Tax=Mytilus edulis TaxID=6550 RepID=A0A8S3Q5M1_MYTED|nr:unnamed protein product [Mytilus edulis]